MQNRSGYAFFLHEGGRGHFLPRRHGTVVRLRGSSDIAAQSQDYSILHAGIVSGTINCFEAPILRISNGSMVRKGANR
jgi:hypothetical protein